MGRLIGLIACSSLVATGLWLANWSQTTGTVSAGLEPATPRSAQAVRDQVKRGKELYLRGRHAEAVEVLREVLSTPQYLTRDEQVLLGAYLARAEARLRSVTARGQAPDADPFAELDALQPEPAPTAEDALRMRVDRLMQSARAAHRAGKLAEAVQLAQQAERLAKQGNVKFSPGETTPTTFLTRIQGSKPASEPEIQQAVGVKTDRNEITLTAGETETDDFADFVAAKEQTKEKPAAPSSTIALTPKEQATAMMEEIREDIRAGRYDEARRKALQVREMDVTWTLFEYQPEHALAEIDRRAGTTTIAAAPKKSADAPAATSPAMQAKKQQALRLLAQAREDIRNNRLSAARVKALQAKQLNVQYQLFEERPELVLSDIEALETAQSVAKTSAEPATTPADAATTPTANDAAKLLRQARVALSNGQLAEAREKATAAQKLNAEYGPFDDRPELVLEDIARMSPSDTPAVASADPKEQARALLKEARDLLKQGRLDEAQQKAQAAQKLDVVYDVLSDRPDLVLDDIRKARSEPASLAQVEHRPSAESAVRTADGMRPIPDAAPQPLPIPEGNVTSLAAPGTKKSDPFATDAGSVDVIHPNGKSAFDYYNEGMYHLGQGDRDAAYQAFLKAHRSGQKLDQFRTQRLNNFLRELAPSKSQNIQLVHQVTDDDLAGETSSLETADRQEAVKFDRLRTDVLNAVYKAERLREQDPDKALEIVDRTMASVEGSALPEDRLTPLVTQLQRTRASVESERLRQEPNLVQKRKNAEVEARIRGEQEMQIRIEQEYAQLVEEFNTLFKQQRYAEAELVARKAEQLDPKNPVSQTLFWKAKFARRMEQDDRNREGKEESFVASLQAVDEAMINPVITDSIAFPKDWADLSKRRKGRFNRADNRTRSEAEIQIEESLSKRISLSHRNSPLEQVINEIAAKVGVNTVFDPRGLEEEGVSSDTPVTIEVNGIMAKSALNLILERLHLAYTVDNEVLKITSRMRQQGDLVVQTYSVADLVVPVPNLAAPIGSTMTGQGLGIPGTALNGAQMSIPATGGLPQTPGQFQVPPSIPGQMPLPATGPGGVNVQLSGGGSTVDFDTLTELIVSTIEPESWAEVGGPASIRPYETTLSLVIRQTQGVHEEIADLLEQLRRLQDLQVAIEVRFVTVSDRFFERIGVDFDFDVQDTVGGPHYDNQGELLPPFGTPTLPQAGQLGQQQQGAQGQQAQQQQGAAGFFTPSPNRELTDRDRWQNPGTVVGLAGQEQISNDLDIPFRQGSFEVGVPIFGSPDLNAGINVGFAILSDIEAFFFIQAVQGDRRSNLLFAPKVTLFNGMTASVSSFVARPFVTSLIPVVGVFSVGFQPVITTIPDGIFLTVNAVISADRRYVRLGLSPFFTNITDVFTFSFLGPAGANQAGQAQQGQIGGGGFGGQIAQGGQQFGFGGIGGGPSMALGSALFHQVNQQGAAGQQLGQGGNQTGLAGNQAITIQQPVTQIVNVSTVVSVPDGGTVLLGGVKRLLEGRNVAGVPILNKIPYISRLFKNTGVGRETESLMMMVTPRIIIQEEEEELLGVPL